MKIYLTVLYILLILLTSCEGEKGLRPTSKGNKYYGGSLKINESKSFDYIFPIAISDVASSHIASQVFEGLVKYDNRTLELKPSLAEKWEISDDGLIYTFFLKKDVKFHSVGVFKNNDERYLTADDVVFSLKLLCTHSEHNFFFNSTFQGRVKGADEFYTATSKGETPKEIEGIKKIDDHIVEVHLNHPSPTFMYIMALPATYIIAKESYEKDKEKTVIGTGPFIYSKDEKIDEVYEVILTKNKNYHRVDSFGNQLPYLDSLIFTENFLEKELINDFLAEKFDLVIGLGTSEIKNVVEQHIDDFKGENPKYILGSSPENTTQFYEFNTFSSVFKNKKLRQAFSYAIDRNAIVKKVLKDEGFAAGIYGVTPPTIQDYDITKIKGYDYQPELAKKLLVEAGYKEGRDLPIVKLQVNNEQSKNIQVALEVIKQLQSTLKVNIDLEVVPFNVKQNDAIYGKGDIYRTAWVADYPSPESFLSLFYGKIVPEDTTQPSFPNITRFNNEKFNAFFEKGWTAINLEESYENFKEAEKILMEEAPILVLWYDDKFKLYHGNIKNFKSNSLNYWDFSEVYRTPKKDILD